MIQNRSFTLSSRVKHTYWHSLAKILIINGYKPAQCAKILREVFPETDINGRHIGAYKRRLVKEEDIIVPVRHIIAVNQMTDLVKELVSTEDMFIYECSVGSAKRTLECFQFKFIAEAEDEVKKVEQWITDIQ